MGGNGSAVVSLAATVRVETNKEKKRTIITDMWFITLWLNAVTSLCIHILYTECNWYCITLRQRPSRTRRLILYLHIHNIM